MKKPMKTKHYARQCQVSVAGVTPHSLRLNGASVRRRSPFGVFLLFLVLCFALFAVSCGDDDGDSGGSISPAISSTSSTSSGSSSSGGSGTNGDPFVALNATQVQIIDGSGVSATKLPSRSMAFDITTDSGTAPASDVEVEFLLVKNGDTVPTTLAEFQAEKTITPHSLNYSVNPSYKSIIKTTGQTSLYLAHDLHTDGLLEPGTQYTLYYVQPNSDDTKPHSMGTFSTGTVVTSSYVDVPFAEDPGTAQINGTLYIKPGQFLIYVGLAGVMDNDYLVGDNIVNIYTHNLTAQTENQNGRDETLYPMAKPTLLYLLLNDAYGSNVIDSTGLELEFLDSVGNIGASLRFQSF